MKRQALLMLLAAPLALAACGDSPGADVPPLQRLALEPTAPRGPRHEPHTLGRIELPAELSAWGFEGASASFEQAEGERVLLLAGDGQKRISVPAPLPADGANELVVELSSNTKGRMRARVVGADGEELGSTVGEFAREPRRERIELAFPAPADATARLVLELEALGPQALHGIELRRRPPAGELPDPGDGEPLLARAGEQRRAHVLVADRPLEARARVPKAGRLRFALGALRGNLRRELPGARLVVRVEARGRAPIEGRYELPANLREPWRAQELDLSPLAGREALVRFAIEGSANGELACALSDARLVAPETDAPMVLLVSSDTHRADHVGVARGAQPVRTPALDALAARGVWFEDCYTSTNVTNPSHMALLTGLHPRDHGILDNATGISDGAETLAERFAAAGYSCLAALSVRHLDPEVSNLGQGFHCADAPQGERPARDTLAQLTRWMAEREGEPLFVWLHVFDVHGPYSPPAEVAAEVWPPERDPYDPALPALEIPGKVFEPQFTGLRDLDYPSAMYRAEVDALDRQLAGFLELPRVQRAVVALTADHGESLGEHGIFYSHAEVYPQSLHVPLILAWPGGPEGLRIETPVRQIDVGRTLLELAGIPAEGFPGQSLVAAAEGAPATTEPRFALAANRTSASITIDGWHLVLGLRGYHPSYAVEPLEEHRVELFHLPSDPAAATDLAEEELERARRLRARLVDWLTAAPLGDLANATQADPELLKHLAALGYADGGADAPGGVELIDADCGCDWCARYR